MVYAIKSMLLLARVVIEMKDRSGKVENMKLIELLETIDENSIVELREYGKQVALYDGKSSIDEQYNYNTVLGLSIGEITDSFGKVRTGLIIDSMYNE